MWADSRANMPARYDDAGEPSTTRSRPPSRGCRAPAPPTVTITQPGAGGTAECRRRHDGMSLTGNGTVVTIVIKWQQPAHEQAAVPVTHNYTMTSIIAHN